MSPITFCSNYQEHNAILDSVPITAPDQRTMEVCTICLRNLFNRVKDLEVKVAALEAQ
jgi:hypothetical protein